VPSVTLLKLTIVRLPLADPVIAPMTVRHWPRPGSEVSEECPPPPAPSSQPQGRRRHWSAGDTVARGLVCLAAMALLKLTIVCLPLPGLRHCAHDSQALATPRLGGLGRVPASACSLVSPRDDRGRWSTEDTVNRGPVCLAAMALLKLTIVCLPLPALASSHP
jgi:hypothetical protein